MRDAGKDVAKNDHRKEVSESTHQAYARDWRQFAGWCRRHGREPLPPCPGVIGAYLTELAEPPGKTPALSVSSIERRLSGLSWSYGQRGFNLDRTDSHLLSVLAELRRQHARPPARKEAITSHDVTRMLATLPHDLRGLRDRAILLVGFCGALRRSEIVGLDRGMDDTPESCGWMELRDDTVILRLRRKGGLRDVRIVRGTIEQTCPVHAVKQWLFFAKITAGPVFVGISRCGRKARPTRLNSRHVARLVKQTALAAGLRTELSPPEVLERFSGNSLKAGGGRWIDGQ